jgi:hypothetical protein
VQGLLEKLHDPPPHVSMLLQVSVPGQSAALAHAVPAMLQVLQSLLLLQFVPRPLQTAPAQNSVPVQNWPSSQAALLPHT